MNIRYFREREKLTQEALAKALNVSAQTIWRWENGERKPDLDMVFKIADFFSCSFDDLLSNPPMPSIGILPRQSRERRTARMAAVLN